MSELNGLKDALAALEKQRALLGDAVVDAAVAPIKEKIRLLEKNDELSQETRKIVTILFADVSGFTAMSENMDAELVSETINELWQHVDQCVLNHRGKIDKHIGDAVMALFGAERSSENDVEAAIDAAIEMQKAILTFNENKQLPNELKMRIGINTGHVLLGNVGSNQEFTAMGDAVNLASRLEHAAQIGGILVSHDTFRHIQGIYNVIPQAPLTVKGKLEPVRTYVIQSKKDKAFRLNNYNFEGLEIKMVGRDKELGVLKDAFFDTFKTPAVRMISICGETGIGKSRLLYEFRSWMQLEPLMMRFLQGQCLEQNKLRSFALIADIFSNRFHISENDSSHVSKEKFEKGISEFLGADSLEQAHYIGFLIGLDYKDSPYLKHIINDAKQIHSIAVHHLIDFVIAMSNSQANGPDKVTPIELLIEDIQWIDQESLEILTEIINQCSHLPMLVLITARSDYKDQLKAWENASETKRIYTNQIMLQPLDKGTSQELIRSLLRYVPELPHDISSMIIEKTGGNPFYMEELIRMLMDEKIIIKGDDKWRVQDCEVKDLKIPQTLSGIVQTRLDHLTFKERETLNRAAIFGYRFWDQGITALRADANLNADNLSTEGVTTLMGLKDRELVLNTGADAFGNSKEYTFCHSLFYEVTYESILLKQRRTMHEQAAEWLIQNSGDRSGEYASMIADHYSQAQNYKQACLWMGQATIEATRRYALDTAVMQYSKAMELFSKLSVDDQAEVKDARVGWMQAIAEVLRMKARHQEAVEIYQQIIKELTVSANGAHDSFACTDSLHLARAYNGYANVCESQGKYPLMVVNAECVISLVQNAPCEDPSLAHALQTEHSAALYYHGKALMRLGKIDESQRFAQASLDLAKTVQASREIGNALNLLGLSYRTLGQVNKAAAYYEEALAIERQRCDRNHEAAVLNNLADIKCSQGDFYSGVILFQEALRLCRATGMKDVQLVLLANLGWALQEISDYAGAVEAGQQALQLSAGQNWQFRPFALSVLASALALIYRTEEAVTTAWLALESAVAMESPEFIGYALKALGIVAGQSADAMLNVPSEDVLLTYLGKAALEPISADECFIKACSLFEQIGAENEKAMTLVSCGNHLSQIGKHEEANQLKNQAVDIFKAVGAAEWVNRLTAK